MGGWGRVVPKLAEKEKVKKVIFYYICRGWISQYISPLLILRKPPASVSVITKIYFLRTLDKRWVLEKKIILLCRFRGILGDNSVNMDGTVIYSKYTELY